jgi:hypothetical protein
VRLIGRAQAVTLLAVAVAMPTIQPTKSPYRDPCDADSSAPRIVGLECQQIPFAYHGL